ncbi:myb family transcription factor [Striga hermonthica]|uniref:Myb family transcription factor n=1 Tax=Striga hermonthica TaxID=68872 RepID=A0A9N7R4C4_STRHE|nr:myb family transcription factor [Striga hermonthica]
MGWALVCGQAHLPRRNKRIGEKHHSEFRTATTRITLHSPPTLKPAALGDYRGRPPAAPCSHGSLTGSPLSHQTRRKRVTMKEEVEMRNMKMMTTSLDLMDLKMLMMKNGKMLDDIDMDETEDNDDDSKNKESLSTHEKELAKLRSQVGVMEKANLGPNMQGESLSTHEKVLARLLTQIVEMGRANLEPKTWTIQGYSNPAKGDVAKGNVVGDDLVRGKQFTPDENEIVKAAVNDYMFSHDLGDDGLDMVLNCKKHRNVRGCWKEIGSAFPYRPYTAVYFRAQWTKLAAELGKNRFHVRDTWRRIKTANRKKGHWSQEEYQKLFDLVNIDLQAKLQEDKKSKYGMLRDNICWTTISDELTTRSQAVCCIKCLDATCMEDVEWDGVVEGRSGDVCRKRWNHMVMHLGCNGHKPFGEQVEILAQRYCPHLLEARETWDNKPRVP